MKWKTVLTSYRNYLRIERGLSENSIANYSRDVRKLITFLETSEVQVSPLNIGKETVQQFIYEIAKNIAPSSQARVISGLHSFFSYLVFEDYREDNPTELIESPKLGRKLPDTLSIDEIDRITQAIDLSHPQGERNRAIIETLYACGLRVSELVSLKISDLYFNEGFIRVTGKGDKQRLVPISDYTQKLITIYKDQIRIHQTPKPEHTDTLYLNRRGSGLTRAMIFSIVKQLVEKAGIHKTVSPHTFRHSFATHLLANGADLRAIQQMLGHESITTTEIYTHIDRSQLADALLKYHPRSGEN